METPQENAHHCFSVGEHILRTLPEVEPDKVLRLTMLFHDMGKPRVRVRDGEGTDHFIRHGEVSEEIAGTVLRRLKFDNDTVRRVRHLVRVHDYLQIAHTPRGVRRAVFRIGEDYFPDYLKVRRADILAQNPQGAREKLKSLAEVERLYRQELEEQNCLSLKDLAVTGRDLIEAGMPAGPGLGSTLAGLLELVIENPECNTKEYLLKAAFKQA